MSDKTYSWHTTVRNYELDNQGIVNNATYLNYLEECRNGFVQQSELDLVAIAKAGYHFVVSNIEINYRKSLTHNQEFYVTAEISSITDKRFVFSQAIYHTNDNSLVADAKVTIACIDLKTRKSCMPDSLKDLLNNLTT